METINKKIEQVTGEMNGLLVHLQDQYEEMKDHVRQEAYNPFLNEEHKSSLSEMAQEIEEKQAFLESHQLHAQA